MLVCFFWGGWGGLVDWLCFFWWARHLHHCPELLNMCTVWRVSLQNDISTQRNSSKPCVENEDCVGLDQNCFYFRVLLCTQISATPKKNKKKKSFPRWILQHFGIKPFTVRWLILMYSAVYYWDKPIQKSSYVGFALFFVLRIPFVSMILTCFPRSCPIFLFFRGPKHNKNLCLNLCRFANYADCFTLRFVFNVRLMILWYIYIFENKYIYTFNFNNL